jgi:hypothetical protein
MPAIADRTRIDIINSIMLTLVIRAHRLHPECP